MQKLENPAIYKLMLLDSAIAQMEAEGQNARRAIVNIMASQKRLQQQYEQAQAEVNKWERRTQLALQKGDEFLVQETLKRRKMHTGILSSLGVQCTQEPASVKSLKQNLVLLEAKISEAKTMRVSLKAQIAAAKPSGQLQSSAGELAGADLELVSARLESSDVDLEIEAMKQQMLAGSSAFQPSLPGRAASTGQQQTTATPQDAEIDSELEDLKRQLDQL